MLLSICECLLTIKVTSQQLNPQCGLLLKGQWVNSDVATHNGWRKQVLLYSGTVHVSTEGLKTNKKTDVNNTKTMKDTKIVKFVIRIALLLKSKQISFIGKTICRSLFHHVFLKICAV